MDFGRRWRRRREGIPPGRYDRQYFLSDRCEGYREFLDDGGVSHVKEKLLARVAPHAGEAWLEIGCGRGEVLGACADRGAAVVGIDYAREAVAITRDTLGERGVVAAADASRLPFRDAAFDGIFLGDVVEHLTSDQAGSMLEEALRTLRPGGRLVLHTSPNVLFIRLVFPWALLGLTLLGKWRLVRLLVEQYRTIREFHVREYSRGRLRRLFAGTAFEDVVIECDPDLLRGGRSRYTESLAASPWIRGVVGVLARDPWVRVLANDLWVTARKSEIR